VRRLLAAGCVWLLLGSTLRAADPREAIARARLHYNRGEFEAAVMAADEARLSPERADSADLVAARAYLERYRSSAAPEDLAAARERLRRIAADRLAVRERTEFAIGLGEALYFDESPGAAAVVFEIVLGSGDDLLPHERERVLDWWASALDREARPRPELERTVIYQRIRERMGDELRANSGSATAAYWMAAAARGQGDLQAAWASAMAGWARAPLTSDQGSDLRGDLDRLVLRGIIPDRARVLGRAPERLLLEWEEFKEKWRRE
jgi:hypothetical protein